jgi:hypothetical protein
VSALARRAIELLLDATLAVLVVVTAIGCGAWLAIELLDAGTGLTAAFGWAAAAHALAAFAGLLAVADIVLAWRERARRAAGQALAARREMPWIALVAAIAAVAIALETEPEAVRLRSLVAGHPVMRTNWWPAIGTALIAWCALLLSMAAPARSRTSLRALAAGARVALVRAGPRAAARGIAGAARMSAWAGKRVSASADRLLVKAASIHAGRFASASRPELAPQAPVNTVLQTLWPAPQVRLGVFLLMLAPIACAVLPALLAALEYGGTTLVWLGAASMAFPPVVAVLLLLVLLVAFGLACVAALLRLWWSLREARADAPAWSIRLAEIGTVLCALGAWGLRDAQHRWPLAPDWRLGGYVISPLAVIALDGAVLLALRAVPRWPAAFERMLRALGYVEVAALVASAASGA